MASVFSYIHFVPTFDVAQVLHRSFEDSMLSMPFTTACTPLSDCSHGGEGEAVATLTTRQILPTPIPRSKLWQNNYLPPSQLPLFFSSLVCDYGGELSEFVLP